jgi:hypothetical protein
MNRICVLAVTALLGLLGSLPAVADGDLQIATDSGTESKDSREIYLDVSARYFGYSPEAMSGYADRYGAREDLAVMLFVASRTVKTPEQIHQLRLRGLHWWEISTMNELDGDVWFTELESKSQEDSVYGPAYRQLDSWNRGEVRNLELSDDDVRNLVAVRVIHEVFDLPVSRAMELRSTGRELPAIVSDQQRLRDRRSGAASE